MSAVQAPSLPQSFSQIQQQAKCEFAASEHEPPYFLATPTRLKIKVNGCIYAQLGSMIAYQGAIKFTRGSGGTFMQKLAKVTTGEGPSFMKCEGNGILWLANQAKSIQLLHLNNESISVNGHHLLMMESNLTWKVEFIKTLGGMMAGGLFNVVISGTGTLAITARGEPQTLFVAPNHTVFADPNCTVAWSGNLRPHLRTDMSFKTFLGRGSGETFQMEFQGAEGFVVVQPYEEIPVVNT